MIAEMACLFCTTDFTRKKIAIGDTPYSNAPATQLLQMFLVVSITVEIVQFVTAR